MNIVRDCKSSKKYTRTASPDEQAKLKSDEIMEVWSYDMREKDFDSFVKILGSKTFNNDEVVFIEVSHVLIGSEFIDVDFMPFSKDLLMGSLIKKVNEEDQNSFQLNKKISEWLAQKGGVWNVSIKEAIDITEQTMLG